MALKMLKESNEKFIEENKEKIQLYKNLEKIEKDYREKIDNLNYDIKLKEDKNTTYENTINNLNKEHKENQIKIDNLKKENEEMNEKLKKKKKKKKKKKREKKKNK